MFNCWERRRIYIDDASRSRSQTHLAKRKRIGWSIGFNQVLYAKFVSMMFQKCSIVEDDGELVLMALHTHFLPQQQYSRVHVLFLASHTLVYRIGCRFLSLFSQDNEHTELTMFLFFQNPLAIFAHILQHYHDFQSNVAIYPSIVRAHTESYSFSRGIKLIIC